MDSNGGEPVNVGIPAVAMEAGDWRDQLHPDSRTRSVTKITDAMAKRYLYCGQERLQKIKETAIKFEEKVYKVATSQSEYLRRIAMEMLTIETETQNIVRSNGANLLQNLLQANEANGEENFLQSNGPNSLQNLLQSNGPNSVQYPWKSNGGNNVQTILQFNGTDSVQYLWQSSGANPFGNQARVSRERRDKVHGNTRYVIYKKIMETFIKYHPSGRMVKHRITAQCLEKKIYMVSTSEPDYLKRISTKMLAVETMLQDRWQSNGANNELNNDPSDERCIWHPSSYGDLITLVYPGLSRSPQPQISVYFRDVNGV